MSGQRTARYPWDRSSLADTQAVATHHQLSLFLGGSEDGFTCQLLDLFQGALATPANTERLQLAFPYQYLAWRTWMNTTPAPTAGELRTLVTEALDTVMWWACIRCQVYWHAATYGRVSRCSTCGGPVSFTYDAKDKVALLPPGDTGG